MKKISLILFIILLVVACKKDKSSPEGPTDVRIRNLSTFTLQDVTVDIDTVVNYGVINGQATSKYIRFPKAYKEVKIIAKIDIDGLLETFTTGYVDYTYLPHIGRMKITYEIFISNQNSKLFGKNEVILDEEIFLDQE